jgi:universal stress protein A
MPKGTKTFRPPAQGHFVCRLFCPSLARTASEDRHAVIIREICSRHVIWGLFVLSVQLPAQRITRNAQHLTKSDKRRATKQPTIPAMKLKTLASPSIRNKTENLTFRLKKILVPVDFSAASENAFKYALRVAGKFSAEITLLYVLTPAPSPNFAGSPGAGTFSQTEQSSAEKNLRSLIASTRNGSVGRAQWTMRAGIPSHEIVEMAKEADIDLIVIATHGNTSWQHFCIGSTAERVVRAAPCPVLVVREKEHEFC